MTDPYAHGMINYNPYAKKKIVTARVVAVLRGTMDKRGLSLIAPKSRALRRSEIHEIIVTGQLPLPFADAQEGTCVSKIVD